MESTTAPLAAQVRIGQTSYRIEAIDLLRGIVMVIMALDHTRDYFHESAFTADPLNLQTTTPLLFFTRWITHFCAPVFVFLSGTSAYLQGLRKNKASLSGFLIKRGFWLILVEALIITFALTFDIHYSVFGLQVIWAIGISMILLGLAVWMPFQMILATGLLIMLGHNSLDFMEANHKGPYLPAYNFLHVPGFLPVSKEHAILVLYPFLPWTGIMFLGYCFGKVYRRDGIEAHKISVLLGVGLTVFFMLLRFTNLYGDPIHWTVQKNALYTVLSFIDTQKYPPSLLYTCMTIGPALIILGWMGKARNSFAKMLIVYGRVPFFYYVLHFYLIHTLCMMLFLSRGHSWKQGVKGDPNVLFKFILPGEGYSLGTVYLIWLLVVVSLYPLCKWFNTYKKNRQYKWLSYV